MKTMIFKTSSRLILWLLLGSSLFLLLRGHNLPGGGFVGGLCAGAAFIQYALAYGVRKSRLLLRMDPVRTMGFGLGLAFISGGIPLMMGKSFLEGIWIKNIPVISKIGTPVLFDIGIYFLVLGMVVTVFFNLIEEE